MFGLIVFTVALACMFVGGVLHASKEREEHYRKMRRQKFLDERFENLRARLDRKNLEYFYNDNH